MFLNSGLTLMAIHYGFNKHMGEHQHTPTISHGYSEIQWEPISWSITTNTRFEFFQNRQSPLDSPAKLTALNVYSWEFHGICHANMGPSPSVRFWMCPDIEYTMIYIYIHTTLKTDGKLNENMVLPMDLETLVR